MNIELTGNTAYGKFEFQTNEILDHTYESLENYEHIGRVNEVNAGRYSTPGKMNLESTDTYI